ncbi:MAG: DnaJ domain-containing protein [Nitrospirae bacterium]|nr:DnaJ domain-containing protein [Nitrospirota bacterium]
MSWKCPECGINNDNPVSECTCGYAFYKILGVKKDASEEEVKQAYKYLQNVWEIDRFSHDPSLQKKARERLKKIDEAYDNFKHFVSNRSVTEKRKRLIKITSFAGIIILVFITLLVFLNISRKDKPQEQLTARPGKIRPWLFPEKRVDVQDIPKEPGRQSFEESSRTDLHFSTEMSPEEAEGKAIELVKKSYAIDRFSDVETLMKKWTDEVSGKFQIIGWKAKKMDDQTYLVSYTASDGLNTKGFYFDINTKTGTVRHIADHPELQKKYGIQYNK